MITLFEINSVQFSKNGTLDLEEWKSNRDQKSTHKREEKRSSVRWHREHDEVPEWKSRRAA